MSSQCHELADELVRAVRRLKDQVERLERDFDELEPRWQDKLNQAYAQGVRDATKARTGHDPAVEEEQ